MKRIIITIDDDGRFVDISTEEVKVQNEKTENNDDMEVKTDVTKDSMGYSQYARVFDEGCPGWTKDSEYNLAFLKHQEDYSNELLKARGYVFLNEVYDMLGIPKSKAGQVVGWTYDEKNPNGDNRVDFGLYNPRSHNFINGRTSTVILDFNVDGIITDLIWD